MKEINDLEKKEFEYNSRTVDHQIKNSLQFENDNHRERKLRYK